MAGVALWFISSEKNWINIGLFAFAFIFTTLATTDLCPSYFSKHFIKPYTLKAVPCIFVWFNIIYDMLMMKPSMIAGSTDRALNY